MEGAGAPRATRAAPTERAEAAAAKVALAATWAVAAMLVVMEVVGCGLSLHNTVVAVGGICIWRKGPTTSC
jgi:hypothetical protein